MSQNASFGQIVKERRSALDLTQAELANRVGCAPITIRRIEANNLRPSYQMAELLALALRIPEAEQLGFVRLAREKKAATPIPRPTPSPGEIGMADLTGRAVKGFQLGELIGSGGFGVVYRAVQPSVNRDVAVKIILPRFANQPDFIRRFEAEAQLVARLEHPHIVPLYDYWREPDAAYLIMRLLRGGSLEDQIKSGPISLADFQKIVPQICIALHTAHRNGIIHRDIKPANVMLDEDKNGYLTDFGIAKNLEASEESQLTQMGALIGSPAYISPEQILAEPIQAQSDIYCLGIMLFEILTGKKPFPGPTPVAYIQQHINDRLPSLLDYQSDLSPLLDEVIQKATEKKPGDRYQSTLDLLADLEQSWQTTPASVGGQAVSPIATLSDLSAQELAVLENPYRGLRPFTEADADNFYGRTALVQELLGMMADGADLSRFVAVVGPSGSGKSSAVKAGLIPALRRGGLPNSDSWFVVDLTPGTHPWEKVEAALLRIAVNPPDSLLAQLRGGERGLLRAVQRILPEDDETELLLVIDQFEELFTLVEDEAVRAHFLESLVTAVLDPDSRLRLIITLRADFTDRPLQYVDFGDLMRKRTAFVLPLTPQELTDAVTRPVSQLNMEMEPALVATIIREVDDQPGMLPLLQYALTELFEERNGRLLTLTDYNTTGGALGALARRADDIFNSLDAPAQEATRQLFLRLITLGEGVEDTRRRVLQSELMQLNNNQQSTDISHPSSLILHNLEEYGRYRLLTFDHDPVTRSATVEVAHEALLREWPRLRNWLVDSREDVRRQRLLAEAAAQWEVANQESSYLLRGSRLIAFESWTETTTMALTEDERHFLESSTFARDQRHADEAARQQRELETAQQLAAEQKQHAEDQTRAAKRLRLFAAGLVVFLLIAIGAALFANTQRTVAQDNFVISERTRLAAQAQNVLEQGIGGNVAALLALRSLKLGYTPEADAALQNALRLGFFQQEYLGHNDALVDGLFSPDGRSIITSGRNGSLILWDTQSAAEIRQLDTGNISLNTASFSPDGQYILSNGSTSQLWDVETGAKVRQFPGQSDGTAVNFSKDGRFMFATGGAVIKLWDLQTGLEIREFAGHVDSILWADLSPNDQYLASVGEDGTVRLWEVETGVEVRQFVGHTGWVGAVHFSPDGRYLVTSGEDRTARIWDVESGAELRRFVGHSDAIYSAYFSPDGKTILTGSFDKTARIWDIESGQEIRQILGHTDYVNAQFSPNGQLVLTVSGDQTVRLWDTSIQTEPLITGQIIAGHQAFLTTSSISPDAQLLVTGESDGKATVRTMDSLEQVQGFRVEGTAINTVTFSPDSQLILVGDNNGNVTFWDTQKDEMVHQFQAHSSAVRNSIFSPNGEMILTSGEDGEVRLWENETGIMMQPFSGHVAPVRALAFSADGKLILSGSDDTTVTLWNVDTGKAEQQFMGHGRSVLAVTFSPDNQLILTGGDDDIAILWDANTGDEIQRFVGHTDQITQVAFSPDGQTILTGSADQTARLWDIESGQLIRQFVGHASPLMVMRFSDDGKQIITSDNQFTYVWRTELDDVIAFACSQLARDLTAAERILYNLDDTSTCSHGNTQIAEVVPTWTPIAETPIPVGGINIVTELEFIALDILNVQMAVPVQEVFVTTEEGVVRPTDLEPETLALPLYTSSVYVPDDYLEPPFEVGPFPQGELLGITLDEWISASGTGSYTVDGSHAVVELEFDGLIADGVYTVWCVEFSMFDFSVIEEVPCGATDGSENDFLTDENGSGSIRIEMEPFPPSTQEVAYELAIAYHSDGQTYGTVLGDRGMNAHVQMIYDFLPPEE